MSNVQFFFFFNSCFSSTDQHGWLFATRLNVSLLISVDPVDPLMVHLIKIEKLSTTNRRQQHFWISLASFGVPQSPYLNAARINFEFVITAILSKHYHSVQLNVTRVTEGYGPGCWSSNWTSTSTWVLNFQSQFQINLEKSWQHFTFRTEHLRC